MAQRKRIQEEMEALTSLRDLAENYEEIAATRMQKIKDSVLLTRDFLTDLSDIFVDLKSSYPKEVNDLLARRKKADKTIPLLLQKNGRKLIVYLSSNGRLYGPVTKKTYDLFIQDLKNLKGQDDNTDILVIGSAGKEMFDNSSYKKEYKYLNIPDDNISIEDIKSLIRAFIKYDSVHIYYGKFGNVVKQSAIATSITGEDIFETEVPSTIPREDRFIFEPIFERVFNFFETQIMSNLFKQVYHENQLARQASRVNAMEEALHHIEEETTRLVKQKVRLKHIQQNKKQLETISGFILWEVE